MDRGVAELKVGPEPGGKAENRVTGGAGDDGSVLMDTAPLVGLGPMCGKDMEFRGYGNSRTIAVGEDLATVRPAQIREAELPTFLAPHGTVPGIQHQEAVPLVGQTLEESTALGLLEVDVTDHLLHEGLPQGDSRFLLVASPPKVSVVPLLVVPDLGTVAGVASAADSIIGATAPQALEEGGEVAESTIHSAGGRHEFS